MASANNNEVSCESDPNFAVICAFFEKFGTTCGLTPIDILDLQEMLENTEKVPQKLIDLHIKLLRKSRKTVSTERWERAIVKFSHTFSSQDAWEIERFGYKNARISSKVRVLKELLELQFDLNIRFKAEINKISADELRSQPLGKDKHGHAYWFQNDNNCQIRVYKEDPDEETWKIVAKDQEGLVSLISELTDGESKISSESTNNEEDSNSLAEKPLIDTGQIETTSSSSCDSLKKEISHQIDQMANETGSEPDEEPNTDTNLKKRPLEDAEDGNPAKVSKPNPVGEAIEEPLMLVKGAGAGAANETNPIVGAEIAEEVLYFAGVGEGAPCQTGNEKQKNEQTNTHSVEQILLKKDSDISGSSGSGGNSIRGETSPTKSAFKLGTIIDTKTDAKAQGVEKRTKKTSRWDVESMLSNAVSSNEDAQISSGGRVKDLVSKWEKEADEPKKPMFFFGPGCLHFKTPQSVGATVGFGEKVPNCASDEVEGNLEKAKGDIGYRIQEAERIEVGEGAVLSGIESEVISKEDEIVVERPNENSGEKIVSVDRPDFEGKINGPDLVPVVEEVCVKRSAYTVSPCSSKSEEDATKVETKIDNKIYIKETVQPSGQSIRNHGNKTVARESVESIAEHESEVKNKIDLKKSVQFIPEPQSIAGSKKDIKEIVQPLVQSITKHGSKTDVEESVQSIAKHESKSGNKKDIKEIVQPLVQSITKQGSKMDVEESVQSIAKHESKSGNKKDINEIVQPLIQSITKQGSSKIDVNIDQTIAEHESKARNKIDIKEIVQPLVQPIAKQGSSKMDDKGIAQSIAEPVLKAENKRDIKEIVQPFVQSITEHENKIDVEKSIQSSIAKHDSKAENKKDIKEIVQPLIQSITKQESSKMHVKEIVQPLVQSVTEHGSKIDGKEIVQPLVQSITKHGGKIDVEESVQSIAKHDSKAENKKDIKEIVQPLVQSITKQENKVDVKETVHSIAEHESKTGNKIVIKEVQPSVQSITRHGNKIDVKQIIQPLIQSIAKQGSSLMDVKESVQSVAKHDSKADNKKEVNKIVQPLVPSITEGGSKMNVEESVQSIAKQESKTGNKIGIKEIVQPLIQSIAKQESSTMDVKESVQFVAESKSKAVNKGNIKEIVQPLIQSIAKEGTSKMGDIEIVQSIAEPKSIAGNKKDIKEVVQTLMQPIAEHKSKVTVEHCQSSETDKKVKETVSVSNKVEKDEGITQNEGIIDNKNKIITIEHILKSEKEILPLKLNEIVTIIAIKPNINEERKVADLLVKTGNDESVEQRENIKETSMGYKLEKAEAIINKLNPSSCKNVTISEQNENTSEIDVNRGNLIHDDSEAKEEKHLPNITISEEHKPLISKIVIDEKSTGTISNIEGSNQHPDKKQEELQEKRTTVTNDLLNIRKKNLLISDGKLGNCEVINETLIKTPLNFSDTIVSKPETKTENVVVEQQKKILPNVSVMRKEEPAVNVISEKQKTIDNNKVIDIENKKNEKVMQAKTMDVQMVGKDKKQTEKVEESFKQEINMNIIQQTKAKRICNVKTETEHSFASISRNTSNLKSSAIKQSNLRHLDKASTSEIIQKPLNEPFKPIPLVSSKIEEAANLTQLLSTPKEKVKFPVQEQAVNLSSSLTSEVSPKLTLEETRISPKKIEKKVFLMQEEAVNLTSHSEEKHKTPVQDKAVNLSSSTNSKVLENDELEVQNVAKRKPEVQESKLEPLHPKKKFQLSKVVDLSKSSEPTVKREEENQVPTASKKTFNKDLLKSETIVKPTAEKKNVEAITEQPKQEVPILDSVSTPRKVRSRENLNEASIENENKKIKLSEPEAVNSTILKEKTIDPVPTKPEDLNPTIVKEKTPDPVVEESSDDDRDAMPELEGNDSPDLEEELEPPVLEKEPLSLFRFSLDFSESPKSPQRTAKKRGHDESVIEDNENHSGKRAKIRGKRIIDHQLRKSIEHQKNQELLSSDDDIKKQPEKIDDESDEEETLPKVKQTPKQKKSSGKKHKKKKSPELNEDGKPIPPTPRKQTDPETRNKRLYASLGIDPSQVHDIESGAMGVRQSRRIAQIKIKEEAERRKHEEETVVELVNKARKKSKKDEDKDYKSGEKKKTEVVDDEGSEDTSNDSKKQKKRKKKHKEFDESHPWRSSSDDSSSEDEEVIEEEEEEEVLHYVSDHEFSPESDLEGDTEFLPRKRARTVKKESPVEDEPEPDDYPCQKCGKSDHPEWILLCDRCDNGWHCSCLRPPLLVIPEGDWYCPPCQHIRLLEKLQVKLHEHNLMLNKRQIEARRKERLAYVGISLNNVLPKASEARKRVEEPEEEDEDDDNDDNDNDKDAEVVPRADGSSSSSDDESGSATTASDSDEPIYQLRQRRQAHSYRFNDYDDLINSAIQDEMERAGNQGRGKDIATIVQAEGEEAPQSVEPVAIPVAAEAEPEAEKAVYSDDEPIRRPSKLMGRKKSRKLNALEVSSDDAGSDEDFKGTSSESEDDFEEDLGSDDSEVLASGRRKKGRGGNPVRRSTRARTSRYDADFIDDGDSDEDYAEKARRRKKRSIWDESEETDETSSDGSWGRRKRKPAKSTKRPAMPSLTPMSKKKPAPKKKKKDEDSDVEVYRKKKPKIKLNLDEEESFSRRTRGKKINYVDALGSDSDEDRGKRAPPKIESEEEYVAEEDEEEEKVKRDPIQIQSFTDARFTQVLPEGVPTRVYASQARKEEELNPIDQINKNLEEMDESETTKMMEEEDYANKQLHLVALQIEKEKKRKEREAAENAPAPIISQKVEVIHPPINLQQAIEPNQADLIIQGPKKRGRKPKSQFQFGAATSGEQLDVKNNEELSEPPGATLPNFERFEKLGIKEDALQPTAQEGSYLGPESNIEIAAPPQPFSQSQPTPSVITRMLQNKPGQPGYPVGTIRPKQFATMPEREEEALMHHPQLGTPPYLPPGAGLRPQLASPYRQQMHLNLYPRGAPPPRPAPPHIYHHRSLDPSPSGGVISEHGSPGRVASPLAASPGKAATTPPPMYARPPTRFPMGAPPRHPLAGRPAMYHPSVPPYHFGQFPPVAVSEEPPVYGQYGPPEPPADDGGKGFEEEGSAGGGEFGGLVSYFSSQREDDLES